MENFTKRPRSNDFRYDDERLRYAIRASGLPTCTFAREIGFRDSEEIHEVLCGKAPLTTEIAVRIHARYPQLNANWLLTGKV